MLVAIDTIHVPFCSFHFPEWSLSLTSQLSFISQLNAASSLQLAHLWLPLAPPNPRPNLLKIIKIVTLDHLNLPTTKSSRADHSNAVLVVSSHSSSSATSCLFLGNYLPPPPPLHASCLHSVQAPLKTNTCMLRNF